MKRVDGVSSEESSQWVHVFVYGTLKRGECREHCWPVVPQQVAAAWTRGRLVDLGPYPALLAGDDRILGEVWSYAAADIIEVLRVLDQIEVTNQPGLDNEYDRLRVPVTLLSGAELTAETYRYAHPLQALALGAMTPNRTIEGQAYVAWSGRR